MSDTADSERLVAKAVVLLLGLQQAMLIPSIAIWAHEYLKLGPTQFAAFLTAFHGAGLLANLAIPVLSDQLKSPLVPFLAASIAAALGFLGFAMAPDYRSVMALTLLLVGPASCQNGLFFTYLRSRSGESSGAVAARGLFSAAWVVGPFLGTVVVTRMGFPPLFLLLGVVNVAIVLIALRLSRNTVVAASENAKGASSSGHILMAFAALVLLHGSNVISTTIMPIVVVHELGLKAQWVAVAFSVCALIEVVMFAVVARWLKRFLAVWIILFGCGVGLAYYVVLGIAAKAHTLVAAQVLNAFFIATAVGGGMAWFQDTMPKRPGLATGIFMNTFRIATLVAAPVIAWTATSFGSYQASAYAAAAFTVAAAIMILLFHTPSLRQRR